MKKLYLSKENKIIFGVCGGIGEAYDIDPTIVRLITVLLCVFTAFIPVLIVYIAARLIIPEKS